MDIEKWKEFSDAVDKHNEVALAEHTLFKKELFENRPTDWRDYFVGRIQKLERIRLSEMKAPFIGIQKTEVNFWEWCAGKLELRHA